LDRTAKMSHTQNNALHKTGCGVTQSWQQLFSIWNCPLMHDMFW